MIALKYFIFIKRLTLSSIYSLLLIHYLNKPVFQLDARIRMNFQTDFWTSYFDSDLLLQAMGIYYTNNILLIEELIPIRGLPPCLARGPKTEFNKTIHLNT